MILNKNGWGLKEMLVLSGVLVLFLAIAIYFIVSFYDSIGKDATNKYYYEVEEKLANQAKTYLLNYAQDTNDKVIITRNTLRAYGLDISLIDKSGNACSGYVIANKRLNIVQAQGYIKCPDYKTIGYEEGRE